MHKKRFTNFSYDKLGVCIEIRTFLEYHEKSAFMFSADSEKLRSKKNVFRIVRDLNDRRKYHVYVSGMKAGTKYLINICTMRRSSTCFHIRPTNQFATTFLDFMTFISIIGGAYYIPAASNLKINAISNYKSSLWEF